MFGDVVESLLRNVIERDLDIRRQGRVRVNHQVNRHTGATGDGLGELAQQLAQIHLDQRRRAQLQQQRAHLGQRAARQLAQFVQTARGLVRVALPQPRQHFRNNTGRKQCLSHGIMQIARNAAALRGDRSALHLGAQPRVLNRQRSLVAHGISQLDLLCGETARFAVIEHEAAVGFVLDHQRHSQHRLIDPVNRVIIGRGRFRLAASRRRGEAHGIGGGDDLRQRCRALPAHAQGMAQRVGGHCVQQPKAGLHQQRAAALAAATNRAGIGLQQTARLGRDVVEDGFQRLVGVEYGEDVAQAVGDLAAALDLTRALLDAVLQHLLGLLAAADVRDRPHDQEGIADRHIAQPGFNREFAAILAPPSQIQPRPHGAGMRVQVERAAVATVIVTKAFRDQHFNGLVAQLLQGIAKHLAQFGVGVEDAPHRVHHNNGDGRRRQEQREEVLVLGLAQRGQRTD